MKIYDPVKAGKILNCARSYLRQSDRLIYSYGSRTFLSGYDLYDKDHEMRGNIDCSTFVILVLSGISFEESPYAKGPESIGSLAPAQWAENDLFDFALIPDHFTGIAERIGRSYLAGPKGLNLKKAEEMGISLQTLTEEIRGTGMVRRSVAIADHFRKKDACFTDHFSARPGDIVFFSSAGYFSEEGKKYPVKAEISHVGILCEDTHLMINSSGSRVRSDIGKEKIPAVSVAPVFGDRIPMMFARV